LHAALYYTIDALELDPSTHSAVFVTIHKEGNFLGSPERIQNFLRSFGVEPEITNQYLNSFTIKQKINRDAKHAKQLKISSTPMIVVDGKYIVEVRRGRSYQEMLNIVDHIVELQKPNS
jgi:DSBA-like thioredoxin domain.